MFYQFDIFAILLWIYLDFTLDYLWSTVVLFPSFLAVKIWCLGDFLPFWDLVLGNHVGLKSLSFLASFSSVS